MACVALVHNLTVLPQPNHGHQGTAQHNTRVIIENTSRLLHVGVRRITLHWNYHSGDKKLESFLFHQSMLERQHHGSGHCLTDSCAHNGLNAHVSGVPLADFAHRVLSQTSTINQSHHHGCAFDLPVSGSDPLKNLRCPPLGEHVLPFGSASTSADLLQFNSCNLYQLTFHKRPGYIAQSGTGFLKC